MIWKFDNSVLHGEKPDLQTGDKVVVTLSTTGPPYDREFKSFTWGFDEADGFNYGQFTSMIKRETKIIRDALNAIKQTENIDSDIDPE